MAYANLGLRYPVKRSHAAAQMRQLIDLVIPIITQEVWPPENNLLKLKLFTTTGSTVVIPLWRCRPF